MSKQTVTARPYAKALFEIALQQHALANWSELLELATYVLKQAAVQELLDNPRISAQQFCSFLSNVLAAKLNEAGRNFLQVLSAHNRFAVIPEIAELFSEYRAEQEKLAKVKVVSALALSAQEQQNLMQRLKQRLQREVELECHIDPSLIGGLMIHADDLVIDGSVRSQLMRLEAELLN